MNKQTDCIIIGGGFAGIATSIALAKRGIVVTLVESRPFLGGRTRSFLDRDTGDTIDNGQHLMLGCYHNALDVLRTLGTDSLLKSQKSMSVDFFDADGSKHIFKTSLLPGKLGVALGIAKLTGLSPADKFSALRLAALIHLKIVRAEGKTALEFLTYYGQTPQIIKRFWTPIILATLNLEPEIAAASLLVEILRRAFFSDAESSSLLLPTAGLSELLAPFSAWLEKHGGRIISGVSVEKILVENEKFAGVLLDTGEEILTCYGISAIPPRALLRILPDSVQKHFPTLSLFESSPIISLYLWFDKPFFKGDFAAMLDTTTQWIFNRRIIANAPDEVKKQLPEHLALTISAGSSIANESGESLTNACFKELKRAFPAAREAKLLSWKVIKEKTATFKATLAIESKRPNAKTAIEGFFLAGDWTNTKLPATIEGAAQSGFEAAKLVSY